MCYLFFFHCCLFALSQVKDQIVDLNRAIRDELRQIQQTIHPVIRDKLSRVGKSTTNISLPITRPSVNAALASSLAIPDANGDEEGASGDRSGIPMQRIGASIIVPYNADQIPYIPVQNKKRRKNQGHDKAGMNAGNEGEVPDGGVGLSSTGSPRPKRSNSGSLVINVVGGGNDNQASSNGVRSMRTESGDSTTTAHSEAGEEGQEEEEEEEDEEDELDPFAKDAHEMCPGVLQSRATTMQLLDSLNKTRLRTINYHRAVCDVDIFLSPRAAQFPILRADRIVFSKFFGVDKAKHLLDPDSFLSKLMIFGAFTLFTIAIAFCFLINFGVVAKGLSYLVGVVFLAVWVLMVSLLNIDLAMQVLRTFLYW